MILQTVWNECIRFGGHINMQVSYKILQLEVLKKALILDNPNLLSERVFLRQLWTQCGLKCLGLNQVFHSHGINYKKYLK
jgi:hypothetical protein